MVSLNRWHAKPQEVNNALKDNLATNLFGY